MNIKSIRTEINRINDLREALEADVAELIEQAEALSMEIGDYFNGRPEAWQEGDQGQAVQQAIDELDAIASIEFPAAVSIPE